MVLKKLEQLTGFRPKTMLPEIIDRVAASITETKKKAAVMPRQAAGHYRYLSRLNTRRAPVAAQTGFRSQTGICSGFFQDRDDVLTMTLPAVSLSSSEAVLCASSMATVSNNPGHGS